MSQLFPDPLVASQKCRVSAGFVPFGCSHGRRGHAWGHKTPGLRMFAGHYSDHPTGSRYLPSRTRRNDLVGRERGGCTGGTPARRLPWNNAALRSAPRLRTKSGVDRINHCALRRAA